MLELSLLSSLLKVSHYSSLLLMEKMVPVLMLLPGTFGFGIDGTHFLMSGCSTVLRASIFIPNCPDVTSHMNVRSDGHMIHVLERLRACFSLLVFAATGGMGPTAITVFRKLASMLAEKRSINYSKYLFWLCCRLCFSLLRTSVMCLWGHRSSTRRPATTNIDLAYSEGHLESGGLD